MMINKVGLSVMTKILEKALLCHGKKKKKKEILTVVENIQNRRSTFCHYSESPQKAAKNLLLSLY